ncbi:DUF305 domain-containing protein [Pseudomonas fluorescens]|uniref:DUF305 domain-containing protein n=1 Tax=Pseudomonas fluorescens TaxID=294 RepID=UPI001CD66DE9|nr:DUF305 domain-containing protein [Pseudomonas fluorescens]
MSGITKAGRLHRAGLIMCLTMLTVASGASAHELTEHDASASHLTSASASVSTGTQAATEEALFLEENEVAMEKMMADMHSKPSGDVDRDFVEMMIPHHQGGIDMAIAFLKYGHNERLKRLAQEIVVIQQQEIAAMRLAVGDPLPATMVVPVQSPSKLEP